LNVSLELAVAPAWRKFRPCRSRADEMLAPTRKVAIFPLHRTNFAVLQSLLSANKQTQD
jgi:hypothetical protein